MTSDLHLTQRAASIRAPELSDIPRLCELSTQLGYPVAAADLSRRLTHLLARTDHHLLLGESPSGQVVGWIHGGEEWILESEPFCEILGLVVDQGSRGKGIGRVLVAAVETWARERGIDSIRVRSNVARAESHPFYERLGFTRINSQHVYRKALG